MLVSILLQVVVLGASAASVLETPVRCETIGGRDNWCRVETDLFSILCAATTDKYDVARAQLQVAMDPSLDCLLSLNSRIRLVTQPNNVAWVDPGRHDLGVYAEFEIVSLATLPAEERSLMASVPGRDRGTPFPLECTQIRHVGQRFRVAISSNPGVRWLPGYCGCGAQSARCPSQCNNAVRFEKCNASPTTPPDQCGCNCAVPFFGWDCSMTCQPSCDSAHGQCVLALPVTSTPTCLCQSGYTGADCKTSLASATGAGDSVVSSELCAGRGIVTS